MASFTSAKCTVLREAWARQRRRPSEAVPVLCSLGRVAAADVASPMSLPPFDNAAMDGYAVNAAALQLEGHAYSLDVQVVDSLPAGSNLADRPFAGRAAERVAVEIMTGAPVPPGYDTIIPREHAQIIASGCADDAHGCSATVMGAGTADATVMGAGTAAQDRAPWPTAGPGYHIRLPHAPVPHRHVRVAGEDVEAGATLVAKGRCITAADIMLLAAAGVRSVPVARVVHVAVISTGSEIVDASHPEIIEGTCSHEGAEKVDVSNILQFGRIYNSNAPYITARLSGPGVVVTYLGQAGDDVGAFRSLLRQATGHPPTDVAYCRSRTGGGPVPAVSPAFDLIVTIGGVSAGRLDFVPAALADEGWVAQFHGVDMRPGHPVLFAVMESKPPVCMRESSQAVVFALPGNPIAVAACVEFLVHPYVQALLGKPMVLPLTLPQAQSDGSSVSRTDGSSGCSHAVRGSTRVFQRGKIIAGRSLLVQPLRKQGSAMLHSLAEADAWLEQLESPSPSASGADAAGMVRVWPVGMIPWPARRMHGLVLCGGESSRMGKDKANVCLKGVSLAERSIAALEPVCARVFVSLRPGQDLVMPSWQTRATPLFDAHINIGPAAGLLAAHMHDPAATWVVLACDYALVEPRTLVQLAENFLDPATCLMHEDGHPEPLISIWAPQALQALVNNVHKGKTGPCKCLLELGARLVAPLDQRWLININTPDELADAEKRVTYR